MTKAHCRSSFAMYLYPVDACEGCADILQFDLTLASWPFDNLLEAIVELRIQTSLHRLKVNESLDEVVEIILCCCSHCALLVG